MSSSSKTNGVSNGKNSKRPRASENGGSTNDNVGEADESPVKIIHQAPSEKEEPIGLHSRTLLKDILYPLSPKEFMTKYFQQQAVHIQGSTTRQDAKHNKGKEKLKEPSIISNRYQPIIEEGMFKLDTKQLIQETSSDSVFVWLPMKDEHPKTTNKNKTKNNNPLVQSVEIPEAETAWALHQAGGHSLYCRAPPAVEQVLVAKLLKDTGLGCGQYDPSGESMTSLARGEVEMFITAKAGGITDWHYDFQENFTLQLSGVKRWTLQQGTVSDPLRACTPHYRAPDVVESQLKAAHLSTPEFVFDQPVTKEENPNDFNAKGPQQAVTLHPGDAFYFPAGMWHKIEVLEPGVSINVSLMATNYANVTCQALQHYLLKRDEWRQVITHHPDSHRNALEHLKGLLKDLPGIIQEMQQKHGGAEAILPPVLLQPPTFHMDDKEDEQSGVESSDEGEEPEEPGTKKQKKDHVSANNKDEDEEWEEVEMEDYGSDHGEEERFSDRTVVDSYDFQYPTGYNGPCDITSKATTKLLKLHKLIINPLASLLCMEEIDRYYAQRNLRSNDAEEKKLLFLLNVNYAGIESHESAVRVVLRDEPERRPLNQFYHCARDILRKETQSIHESLQDTAQLICDTCPALIHCLLYYGYLIVVPRK